jgi:hypothetical protein
MELLIKFSDDGLKKQFGKIPTKKQMIKFINEAIASYAFGCQFLGESLYNKNLPAKINQCTTAKARH